MSSAGLVGAGLGIGGIFFPPLFIAAAVVGAGSTVGSLGRWYACKKAKSTFMQEGKEKKEEEHKASKELHEIIQALEDLRAVPELKDILEEFQKRMQDIQKKTCPQQDDDRGEFVKTGRKI